MKTNPNILDGASIVIVDESPGENIQLRLNELGAKICSSVLWAASPQWLPQNDIIIAPEWTNLSGIPAWQILFWKRGGGTTPDTIDVFDSSPNAVAQKVAELINESKFKLPEWFEGYNFRWEWTVIEHPTTKEPCRKIRLFKTFEGWNIREKYTHVYLDVSGQLFNTSKKRKAPDRSKNRFAIGQEVIDRTQITEDSTIEVHNSYRQMMVGNNEPTVKNISFFKKTEI